MKHISFLILTTLFSLNLNAQSTISTDSLQQPIINFFNGLSLINTDLIRNNTTKDFQLLESGLFWNTDTLINKIIKLKNGSFERKNN